MAIPSPVLPTCFSFFVDLPDHKFLYLRGGNTESEDYAMFGEVGEREALTSSMHTRFYLVPSKGKQDGYGQLVHIKSSYNNKYLVNKELKKPLYRIFVMGMADEPEEELYKPSCTLFKIEVHKTRKHGDSYEVRFHQPWLGRYGSFLSSRIDLETGKAMENVYPVVYLVDVKDQIILPPYVTFKGDKGMYLRVGDIEGHPYLEFASTYQEDKSAAFSTLNYADGQVCLKSELNGKLLCLSDVWIWADSIETETLERRNCFKALKFGEFFVLQSMGNNQFCTASKKGNTDCLEASSKSITHNTKLALEEPVLSREIYNIEYHRTDHARVYDTKDMNMATATAINRTSKKNTVKSTMSITTTASEKHDSTTSQKTNISGSVTVGLTFKVVSASVKVQYGKEESKEDTWGDTTQTEKKQEIEYEVTVPARKKVTLTVTAKQVKRDIPFSYTQKDKLPNGEIRIYNYDDGLYTGMDCVDLRYHTKEEELDLSKKRKGMTKESTSTDLA